MVGGVGWGVVPSSPPSPSIPLPLSREREASAPSNVDPRPRVRVRPPTEPATGLRRPVPAPLQPAVPAPCFVPPHPPARGPGARRLFFTPPPHHEPHRRTRREVEVVALAFIGKQLDREAGMQHQAMLAVVAQRSRLE